MEMQSWVGEKKNVNAEGGDISEWEFLMWTRKEKKFRELFEIKLSAFRGAAHLCRADNANWSYCCNAL